MINIHFQPSADLADLPEPVTPPRLREVTRSPIEEYRARPGQVAFISDALAASICAGKGFGKATRKGVILDRKDMDGRTTFWKEDSIVCGQLTGEAGEWRVAFMYNRQHPDTIHLFHPKTGAYIESLPQKNRVSPIDAAAAGKEMAAHRRSFAQSTSRLQQLQGDETRKEIERAARNADLAQTAVLTLEAKGVRSQPASTDRTPAHDHADVEATAAQGRHHIASAQQAEQRITREIDAQFQITRPRFLPTQDEDEPFDFTSRRNQLQPAESIDPFDQD